MLSGIRKPVPRTAQEIRNNLRSYPNSWLANQYNNRHGVLKFNSENYWAAITAEIESRKVDGKLPPDNVPTHSSEAPKGQNGYIDGKKIVGYERQSYGGKGQVVFVPILENQTGEVADEA
jgi:hypothetical protein